MKEFPTATYRIQFNLNFTFQNFIEQVQYLNKLGISHCYSSPFLKARKGSTHGYDVVDHSQLNPEIGSLEDFKNFISNLRSQDLNLIVDIVPNHIFIGDIQNIWWRDVLQNGHSSIYADYFDIDWHPPKAIFDEKIYLPILDQPYGSALENQVFQIVFEQDEFVIKLPYISLPTDPQTWNLLLSPLLDEVVKIFDANDVYRIELEKIILSENIKERLNHLFKNCVKIFDLMSQKLIILNGIKGHIDSFKKLEEFLNAQHYRICYWKVANDEVNYRRFFDIFEYASIAIEKSQVFEAAHKFIFDFINCGWIQGLRIDHIDGLWDPHKYLEDLQKATKTYTIVEKILTGEEILPHDWRIHGTVGYDLLNILNSLFIFTSHRSQILTTYRKFSGITQNPTDIQHDSKRVILHTFLASELNLLSRRLNRLAEKHHDSQDFSQVNLKNALLEIIVFFPVYRTYICAHQGEIHEKDRQYIIDAVTNAKRQNSNADQEVYHFIQKLLLLEQTWITEDIKIESADFVMHFQRLTGPVMAKGLEDTAFYRYFPLVSINEVGGEIDSFGISSDQFHKKNLERLEFWPNSLCATTTHDTKRSEDVRARLNVLSEIPEEWENVLNEWSVCNHSLKSSKNNDLIPDTNEEYLLYQTLIGSWPLTEMNEEQFLIYKIRIHKYMEKAIKEAKIHQSWIDPNEEYTENAKSFIDKIFSNVVFLNSFKVFTKKIQNFGMLNSLAQIILKNTIPGIPDLYQGNEIWDFSLVDPDNRHSVDFIGINKLLNEIHITLESLQEYLSNPDDGKIKLFITQQTLLLRKRHPDLFSKGVYLPLTISGLNSEFCVGFARMYKKKIAIVISGRFFSFFMSAFNRYKIENYWSETYLEIPIEFTKIKFIDIFNQKIYQFDEQKISLQKIFSTMPFALLESGEQII